MFAVILSILGGWQTQQQCNGYSCQQVQVWVPDRPVQTPPTPKAVPRPIPQPKKRVNPVPALPSNVMPETVSFRFY